MMDLSIIPECYVDTNLIETIVPTPSGYNHQKGCGTVARVMNNQFRDRFSLGIIDKDKQVLNYLNEFNEVCGSGSLILHKHKTRHHYFIQICPAIERFILDNVACCNLSLSDFGLPTELNEFKKLTKSADSKHDDRFKRLFKAMDRHGAAEVKRLTLWIKHLKEYQYNADISVLKKL